MAGARRALKELEKLRSAPDKEFQVGLICEDEPLYWEASIHGPPGSLYEGGIFRVQLDLSDGYPFKPPYFTFKTDIYHCNLSVAASPNRCSAECLLRWTEEWHPSMDIRTLLLRIYALMMEPSSELDFQPMAVRGCSADGRQQIRVETLSGSLVALLACSTTDCIENLMADLEVREGLAMSNFRLAIAGQELAMDCRISDIQLGPSTPLLMISCVPKQRLETALLNRDLASLLHSDRETYEQLARTCTNDLCLHQSHHSRADDAAAPYATGVRPEKLEEGNQAVPEEQEEEEEEEEDEEELAVELPCPICGVWYQIALLEMHLEGHFAFEACVAVAAAASAATSALADAGDEDAILAVTLQRQEMERTLEQCQQCARDRLAALRLETEQTQPQEAGNWICSACTLENEAADAACAACGAARPPLVLRKRNASSQAKPQLAESVLAENGKIAAERAKLEAHQSSSSSSSAGRQQQATATVLATKAAKRMVKPMPGSHTTSISEAAVLAHAMGQCSDGQVPLDSDQYKAVTEYFLQTLGASNVHIHGVARVNAGGFANFRSGTQQRVMFHGCKTTGNEDAILKDGFQVNACISGGANYGTWFAFNSAYSDSGFAFNDSFGVRHLFVCLVSNASMRMENATMRVVGPRCAYPCWIIRYTHQQSQRLQTFSVGPYGRWAMAGPATGPVPAAPWGYEVKDGQWVPVAKPPPLAAKK